VPYSDPKRKRDYDRQYFNRRGRKRRDLNRELRPAKRGIVTFRLDETIIARVQLMKEEAMTKGTFPWRTSGQVWRALIAAGIKSMADRSQVAEESLPYLAVMKLVEGMRNPRVEAQSVLVKACEELDEMLTHGHEQGATQFFHSTMKTVRKMDPTIWSSWLEQELIDRYPEQAKQLPGGIRLKHKVEKVPERRKRA
jgi:hypothetical protein